MKKHKIDKIKNLDLGTFDAKLRTMAENGAFDDAMAESLERLIDDTKPVKLTNNELNRLYQNVNKASVEKAISEARSQTPVSTLPMGRFLQLVRDRSGLSHDQFARALKKDTSFIERIENGQINPMSLVATEVADIMQLFRLTVTDFVTTLKSFLSTGSINKQRVSGMARSSIKSGTPDQGARLAHAMDALQAAIAKKNADNQPEAAKIDPVFIEKIKRELKKRNAEDLLI